MALQSRRFPEQLLQPPAGSRCPGVPSPCAPRRRGFVFVRTPPHTHPLPATPLSSQELALRGARPDVCVPYKGPFTSCSRDFIFPSVSRILVSCVFLPGTRYRSSPNAPALLRTGRGPRGNGRLPPPVLSCSHSVPASVFFFVFLSLGHKRIMLTPVGVQVASVSVLPSKWQGWKPRDFPCCVCHGNFWVKNLFQK